MEDENCKTHLEVVKVIGYSGHVINGLKCHPDRHHIIYSVGTLVVIENIDTEYQVFLDGHTNSISCLDISPSGRYIASGQKTFSGFKANIIIWNYEEKSIYCNVVAHRSQVEALVFTFNDQYLFSIGGVDDGNVIVWNICARAAHCGSAAQLESAGSTHCIAAPNKNSHIFITAGRNTLRIWRLDEENRKISPTDVRLGKLSRVFRCITFSEDDRKAYLGTTTGDIVMIDVESGMYMGVGPEKLRFSCGVLSISLLPTMEFIIGGGDGTVAIIGPNLKRTKKECLVDGPVTSISMHGSTALQFYVGTSKANIYKLKNIDALEFTTLKTAHSSKITDMAFPYNCAKLLVTCGQTVRVWYTGNFKELLCFNVANHVCNALAVMKNGSCIVTGWSDACLRGYYPETGKPMFVVKSSYGSDLTALATTHACDRIISGSDFGHLVIWTLPADRRTKDLNYVSHHVLLKEHLGRITSICVLSDDSEMVSGSEDGTCIIWNLTTLQRKHMLKMNTLFKQVAYHPDELQVVTCGSNRMLVFWERYDGSILRELEGSPLACVNSLDVDASIVVTGGDDKIIRVWHYVDGELLCAGIGHSAPITRVRICPEKCKIVSSGSDGSIFIWKFPKEILDSHSKNPEQELIE